MKRNKFIISGSTNNKKKFRLWLNIQLLNNNKMGLKNPSSTDVYDSNYNCNKVSNLRYYYKNPQFLNCSNINNQINILMTNINNNNCNELLKNDESSFSLKKLPKLKSLNNLKDNTSIANIETIKIKSRKTSCDSPLNNKNSDIENIKIFPNILSSNNKDRYLNNKSYDLNDKSNDINYIYKNIFSNSALFKEKKHYIDNKLNIVYCQNESQYKYIMEKRNKLLKNKKSVLKYEEDSEKIKEQVDEIKTKIKFMKNVMDYSYPGFMLTKIQSLNKKYSNKKNEVNLSPVEKRICQLKKRNNLRMNYLKQNFKIFPIKV